MQVQADLKSRANGVTGDTATLSIGEVAAAAGIRASAIRYYEERGLVDPVSRQSGRRCYEPAVLRRLYAVELCKDAGFSLDDTKSLLTDRSPNRRASRALAQRKLVEIDERRRQLDLAYALIERGLRCTCPAIDDCSCTA